MKELNRLSKRELMQVIQSGLNEYLNVVCYECEKTEKLKSAMLKLWRKNMNYQIDYKAKVSHNSNATIEKSDIIIAYNKIEALTEFREKHKNVEIIRVSKIEEE